MDPLWLDRGQPAIGHFVPPRSGPGGGLPGSPRGHIRGMPRATRTSTRTPSRQGPGRRTRRPPPDL
eukprot:10585569-Alexandrium_andersonii.AAC.1